MKGPMNQDSLNRAFQKLVQTERLLPIKTTQFYRRKVEEEITALGGCEGPLHRAVYPTKERLTTHAPGEVIDFVSDRDNMPAELQGFAIRKYSDRILFLPTHVCAAHCQYCFRQNILAERRTENPNATIDFDKRVDKLLSFLKEHTTIQEVILSGGDPLTIPYGRLERLLAALKTTHIQHIRIHTRSLVFEPRVFNSRIINLLGAARVRLVIHSIHPYEICDDVRNYIAELHRADVRLYNQFPLLRGINDHAEVLAKHLTVLDELGIRNLSVFIPDPISYSASFRNSPEESVCAR